MLEPSQPSIVPYTPTPPPAVQVQLLPPTSGQTDDMDWKRWLGFARRRALEILGVASIVTSLAVSMALSQRPEYEGQFRLLVEPVSVGSDLAQLTTPAEAAAIGGAGLDYETQIQVMLSPEVLEAALQQLRQQHPELDYDALVGGLSVARLEETKIIEIRYRGDDRAEVQAVLNQLAATYLRYSLVERQTNLRNGIVFVEQQLQGLQARVDQLQSQLQTFRQANRFIEPDAQAQQIASQVSGLEQQRIALDQSMAQARSRFESLQGEAGAVTALSTAPLYQGLVEELQQIEIEIATELTRFQRRNPAIQSLEQQRANLVPLLRQEAQRVVGEKLAEAATQIQLIEAQQRAIAQAQQQLDQTVQRLPALSRQYTDLQRELQVAVQSLNRFQATRETLQTDAAQKEVPWQLITPPQSPAEVAADPRRSILLGMVAGVLAGVGVAMLLEKLHDVYYTVDEVRQKLPLPMLGVVPFQSGLRSLAEPSPVALVERMPEPIAKLAAAAQIVPFEVDRSPLTRFQEAVRVVCTHTLMMGGERAVRSIVISSARAGDGKTTLALHLADAAAAMGQRVLLVDADLRQPQIHQHFHLGNQRGLSDLMFDNLQVRDLLQRPLPTRNLYVITAGQRSVDPTELLSSRKMHQLMLKCHNTFDLVIYDTPPLVGLADASLLAPRTDGLLLVVRVGKTDRAKLNHALETLKLAHTPVLGYVANG